VRSAIARFLVVLFGLAILMGVTACIADDQPIPVPGDPDGYPSGCGLLQPIPTILEDIAVVLLNGTFLEVF